MELGAWHSVDLPTHRTTIVLPLCQTLNVKGMITQDSQNTIQWFILGVGVGESEINMNINLTHYFPT